MQDFGGKSLENKPPHKTGDGKVILKYNNIQLSSVLLPYKLP
jgi:hypothetical protein